MQDDPMFKNFNTLQSYNIVWYDTKYDALVFTNLKNFSIKFLN